MNKASKGLSLSALFQPKGSILNKEGFTMTTFENQEQMPRFYQFNELPGYEKIRYFNFSKRSYGKECWTLRMAEFRLSPEEYKKLIRNHIRKFIFERS